MAFYVAEDHFLFGFTPLTHKHTHTNTLSHSLNIYTCTHTVQLDFDDPTLLEIAELLDAQAGEKYTVMLVKNGEDIDNTNFVHLQMYNEEESCDSVR